MTRTVAGSLIVIGSFLEVFYYYLRFRQDGSAGWLSVIIGVALTLFLAVLTMLRKSNRWAIPAALILASYSIFATAAGQAFALSKVVEDTAEYDATQANAQDAIAEYRQNIERLDREEADLLSSTAGLTLAQRANYRTYGIAPIEERKAAIATERQMWQEKIDAERATLTTHVGIERKSTNVYIFYGELLGVRPETVQVVMQITLSIFIAMMAPTGIIMLTTHADIVETQHDDVEFRCQVRDWSNLSWYGIKRGTKSSLMNQESVKHAADSRMIRNDMFDSILDIAIRRGIIEDNDGELTPLIEQDKAVKILCGENQK